MANEVDPRATVPLPWTRHGSLAEISWREALSKLLLVILPVVLVFALLGWAGDALRRRFAPRLAGEQNASQEHRDKQTLRVGTLITLLATGFVGVFLAGALWIWLVSGELAPGETYCWEGWLWHWLRAGSLAGVGLMVVGGSIIRDWRSGK